MRGYAVVLVWVLILWLLVGVWRLRKRRVTPGAAAAAAMNELLVSDRRAAVQVIVEERAGERDPEDPDGNLPELDQRSSDSRGQPARQRIQRSREIT
jgi:hypothetical protein